MGMGISSLYRSLSSSGIGESTEGGRASVQTICQNWTCAVRPYPPLSAAAPGAEADVGIVHPHYPPAHLIEVAVVSPVAWQQVLAQGGPMQGELLARHS